MNCFEQSFRDLIEVEGGYSDDARDSGGKTNWGITEGVARRKGYQGDMRDLPKAEAQRIYRAQYWDVLNLDRIAALSYPVAHELFDTGVNMGVGRAGQFLQRALNALNNEQRIYSDIAVDGLIGPGTLAALQTFLARRAPDGQTVLLRALNCLQGCFYIDLAEARQKDEAFIFGWFRTRVTIR